MLTGFLMALQNLSRLHISNYDFDEKTFGRSTKYFSLIGLILGVFLYSVYHVSSEIFSTIVVAAILIVAELILSGGMHLDGFMDSMDGLFSGRPMERKLEIMRDSRVGANGVMTLFTLLLLKFTLLIDLPKDYFIVLPLMMAVGRWMQVFVIAYFPYARKSGMGMLYSTYSSHKEFIIATVTILLVIIVAKDISLLYSIITCWVITYFMARQIVKTIGGLTGDTYGAISELNEVIFLMTIYIFIG